MIAILTGDIIGSKKLVATENWIEPLRSILYNYGVTPKNWEIQRGDNFQLEITDPLKALETAVKIKLAVKKVKGMDARIAIGLGEKTFASDTISSSNGSAFIRSYKSFDELRRRKGSMTISTGDPATDTELNLILKLLMAHADSWTKNAAELIYLSLHQPKLSQTELAQELNITQASVSLAFKRSHFNLLKECLEFYRAKVER